MMLRQVRGGKDKRVQPDRGTKFVRRLKWLGLLEDEGRPLAHRFTMKSRREEKTVYHLRVYMNGRVICSCPWGCSHGRNWTLTSTDLCAHAKRAREWIVRMGGHSAKEKAS